MNKETSTFLREIVTRSTEHVQSRTDIQNLLQHRLVFLSLDQISFPSNCIPVYWHSNTETLLFLKKRQGTKTTAIALQAIQ